MGCNVTTIPVDKESFCIDSALHEEAVCDIACSEHADCTMGVCKCHEGWTGDICNIRYYHY